MGKALAQSYARPQRNRDSPRQDFGESMTPEAREREDRLREQVDNRQAQFSDSDNGNA